MSKKHRRPRTHNGRRPEHTLDDPRECWVGLHRLPENQPHVKPPPNILGEEAELAALEYEFYIQPLLNREAHAAYAEALNVVEGLGLNPAEELIRPSCPIPAGWIGEMPNLHDQLIGNATLPRVDPFTDAVHVIDWEELAAWKADVELAVRQLPGADAQLYRFLIAGGGFVQAARFFGWSMKDLLERVRRLNGLLRDQLHAT